MATKTRNWVESTPADLKSVPGWAVWVEDGTLGHYATLGSRDEAPEALVDYAESYDAGEDACEMVVNWTLYHDGKEVSRGQYDWSYPIRG